MFIHPSPCSRLIAALIINYHSRRSVPPSATLSFSSSFSLALFLFPFTALTKTAEDVLVQNRLRERRLAYQDLRFASVETFDDATFSL